MRKVLGLFDLCGKVAIVTGAARAWDSKKRWL